MNAEPKLLPCPFCGSTDLHVGGIIVCVDCRAEGPAIDGDPIELWNRRPRHSNPPLLAMHIVDGIAVETITTEQALAIQEIELWLHGCDEPDDSQRIYETIIGGVMILRQK